VGLSPLAAWLLAATLLWAALLCSQLAAVSGAMAQLLDLYLIDQPQTPLRQMRPHWRAQRRVWIVVCAQCCIAAACMAAVALGWW
jgi:hypothetical protein